MSNINDVVINVNGSTPHSETSPAMVDPPTLPHPACAGCPRWRTSPIVITDSRIYWRSININATMGEHRVISLLVAARGEHISYRTMYDKLKNIPGFRAGYGDDGYRTNVRSMIKRVRKKFLTIDPAFKSIENLQAYGYAWRAG